MKTAPLRILAAEDRSLTVAVLFTVAPALNRDRQGAAFHHNRWPAGPRGTLLRFCAGLLGVVASLLAADGPKLTFIKAWPQSNPPYVEIIVEKSGDGLYKEAADDEAPVKFRLAEKETAEIFALADKLDHFKRPLESNLKVARTGVKTFRYESGAEKNEVQFNYSLDESARLLWDWFERISETERHLIQLERTARFDRLGVNDALLRLQASLERKRLVATQQFLPVLNRIAANERYLHMARERAASLADVFKGTQ